MSKQAVHPQSDRALVQSALRLSEAFAERAPRAEERRRVPDENIAELKAAGLLPVLLPRRVGGHQSSLHTFIDVVAGVGRGCGSTAWVLGVANAHNWLSGLFDVQAQDEVYGTSPDILVSAVIGPRGKAVKVAGGYRLSGFWPFCSGSPAAKWLMLGGAAVDAGDKFLDEGDFLVPIEEVEVKDDWDVVGLRGSGSNSVVVKDVFVPEHRFLSLVSAIEGRNPGQGRHEGTLYDCAVMPVLSLGIVPAAIGIAEGALEAYLQRLPGKVVSYTFGEKQLDMPTTHMQVAEAETRIRTARVLAHGVADITEEHARQGQAMSLVDRAAARMDCAQSVRFCLEAVEKLFLSAGGSSLSVRNPLQRAWRDLHAINMHGLLCYETNTEMYGRVLLGLKQNTPLI